MPSTSDVLFLLAGVGLLLAAWLPRLAAGRAFSAPMLFVAMGALIGLLPLGLPPLPLGADASEQARAAIEHGTEIVVIVALFGVGLAIDRPFGWRRWATTWRLLAIGMPACIGLVAVAGWGLAGLVPASALLLGAVLAPTDPVLASEVQVGAPTGEGPQEEDEVRFSLTTEAGLNDGLAFPFVYAAVLLAGASASTWAGRWLAWELVGKIAIGVGIGLLTGRILARLTFDRPARVLRFAEAGEALVALAGVFLSYGLAEVMGGYGFLAVFVAAVALRSFERRHTYHVVLHDFVDQVERLLTLGVLLGLGYGVTTGLLSALTWPSALVGALLVLAIRPLVGWVSLARTGLPAPQRWAIAAFGVRGIGSFYYLAYAAGQATFDGMGVLISTTAFTVLLSVVLHGAAAGPAMDAVDRHRMVAESEGPTPP